MWLAGLAALVQLPASAATRVTEAKAEPVVVPEGPAERIEAIRREAGALRIAASNAQGML